MSSTPDHLSDFRSKLRERVAALDTQPKWPREAFDRHMQAIIPRLTHFNEIVDHLITKVVGPRLGEFVKHFPQAVVSRRDRPNHCSCSLGYTDRFPVNVKIEFAFDHDSQIEHLTTAHTLDILPTFFKFEQRAQLWLALEGIDDATVAAWVEERLLGFVDAYALVDRGPREEEFDRVTDPICGMRFSRSEAANRATYCGHDYFFCSKNCHDHFTAEPTRFIRLSSTDWPQMSSIGPPRRDRVRLGALRTQCEANQLGTAVATAAATTITPRAEPTTYSPTATLS